MTRSGYEAYILYLALQKHFSSDYDFFKYNGKVKASVQAYEGRQDIFAFEKLVKIIDVKEDLMDFFVSHFLEDSKMYIRSMQKGTMDKWRAHLRQMPTQFKEDMYAIKRAGPAECMAVKNDIPLIHKKVIDGEIKMESVVLLNQLWPLVDKHEKEVDVPFVWPDYIKKIRNYSPFVLQKLDYKYYEEIARDVLLS